MSRQVLIWPVQQFAPLLAPLKLTSTESPRPAKVRIGAVDVPTRHAAWCVVVSIADRMQKVDGQHSCSCCVGLCRFSISRVSLKQT